MFLSEMFDKQTESRKPPKRKEVQSGRETQLTVHPGNTAVTDTAMMRKWRFERLALRTH